MSYSKLRLACHQDLPSAHSKILNVLYWILHSFSLIQFQGCIIFFLFKFAISWVKVIIYFVDNFQFIFKNLQKSSNYSSWFISPTFCLRLLPSIQECLGNYYTEGWGREPLYLVTKTLKKINLNKSWDTFVQFKTALR